MKRLFTGIQPSGSLHIGNYFGALKPFLEFSEGFQSMLEVADLHALTTVRDPIIMRENIINVTKDYLAVGINPVHVTIFKQSDVAKHTELAWIFNCLVTVPFLQQAHAFKDKTAKGLEANVGLFTYPMLMAADILLYDTDVVPVGADQRQHVEYAREAAAKFNNAYGFTFKEPKEVILESISTVPGTDGQKMSKSYGNTIPLFGTKDEIAHAVMSIVTDSSGERPEHVHAIHRLFRDDDDLEPLYEENRGKYKNLKEALIDDIEAIIAPMRYVRDQITDGDVRSVLDEGATRARAMAAAKMEEVRRNIGVTI